MSTIFSQKSVTGDIDVGRISNHQYRLDCCSCDIDIQEQVLEKPEGYCSAVCCYFNPIRVFTYIQLRLIYKYTNNY